MPDALLVTETQILTEQVEEITILSVAEQGPPGATGPIGPSGGSALTVTAGPALGGHRLVVMDGADTAQYADPTNLSHAGIVLGMTVGAVVAGQPLNVIRLGEITEPTWNWTLNQPVYLGLNGVPTQTLPPTAVFSLVVGFPITSTKLFVSIREPIVIA